MKKYDWKHTLLTIWDILFVLGLCFAVLLTTMLLSRSAEHETLSGYIVNPALLAGVVISVTSYLLFILHASRKGLRQTVDVYFSSQGNTKEGELADDLGSERRSVDAVPDHRRTAAE